MKRLAIFAAALTVAVLTAVPFDAFALSVDYRAWLQENGATPVIAGGTSGTSYHTEYPPTMAFDGLKDMVVAHRYLGSIQNGAYLIYGGDVPEETFTTTHYRVWQLTCGDFCNDRAPTAWTLFGADTKDGPWTAIESRSGVKWSGTLGQKSPAPALSECWRDFELETPQTYKFYKIAFTDSGRPAASDTWTVGVMEVEFRNVVESSLSVVAFDANGGEMANEVRIVRTGGTYGENVNIYPSDSVDNFSVFSSDALTLTKDGVFTYEYKNQYCNFYSKPIANILPGMSYTYVLDCLEVDPEHDGWAVFYIGDTSNDGAAQLTKNSSEIRPRTTSKLFFRTLTGRDSAGCSYLSRDYIQGNAGRMKFRISLFAGTGITKDNYSYVAPGEGHALALPIPTHSSPNYVFEGWEDEDGRAVTESTEVTALKGQNHTLKAKWRLLPGKPVKVTFDANGGTVDEAFRIVNTLEPYGRNVNIYPSDSVDNFSVFSSDALTLTKDGVFTYEYKNQYCNFYSKPIANVLPGMSYTYVLDCLEVDPEHDGWAVFYIGDTSNEGTAQLTKNSSEIRPRTTSKLFFRTLTGRDSAGCSYLSRDYIQGNAGRMKFRISLFAGTGITKDNYSYVAPGEGHALALPTAKRKGERFDCWVDENGNRVTNETLVGMGSDHVLTAKWQRGLIVVFK